MTSQGHTPLKPPMRYVGGKVRMAQRIAALLPDHNHYVEPFAGALAVLLAKPPSRYETVNDLNEDLVTFWRVLRDRPVELERACVLTPHARAERASASHPAAADCELERARRVWVNLTQGWTPTVNGEGWRATVKPHGPRLPWETLSVAGRIAPAAERLRLVTLECVDAVTIIQRLGAHSGTCIYADPPYLGSARAKQGGVYANEMVDEASHRRLAAALNGCAASVVLSGYRSDLYEELYEGWEVHEFETRVRWGTTAEDRARIEVVWIKRSGYEHDRKPGDLF